MEAGRVVCLLWKLGALLVVKAWHLVLQWRPGAFFLAVEAGRLFMAVEPARGFFLAGSPPPICKHNARTMGFNKSHRPRSTLARLRKRGGGKQAGGWEGVGGGLGGG